jgi:3-hydroxyisobutyrate dehydrogenase-like beta-hydroxyacid dehydrogenase
MEGAASDAARIAMIGFGEAAGAFAAGWGLGGSGRVRSFDVKLLDPPQGAVMRERCRAAGVEPYLSPAAALAAADLGFCLVTADQALAAARAAAAHIAPGALWIDGNSCSPGTKRTAAAAIEAAGGAYVDMAIMAPVNPRRHLTPVLLSGPAAERAAGALRALGMVPEVAGPRVGDASTIKMLRSVMVKGLEALTAECVLAARRAGVEDAVLGSLDASDPGRGWQARASYNLERMVSHGARRAAEMHEAAATLREIGLPHRMASATAQWQEEIGSMGLDGGAAELGVRADLILARLR